MKRRPLAHAVLLVCTAACADGARPARAQGVAVTAPRVVTASQPARAPRAGVVAPLLLVAHETRSMLRPGASAAFSLDTDVVEASMRDGRLVLTARGAGEALVSIVTPSAVETLAVRVTPAPSRIALAPAEAARNRGSAELRYDSATERLGTSLALQAARGERQLRVQAQAVHDRSGRARSLSLPSASVELRDGERRAVLLDDFVEDSPLTIDDTVLRGVHLDDGRTQIRAGASSSQPWDDLVLPREGDRALSVSHRIAGGRVDFVPRALWLPDSRTDVPGVLALGLQQGAHDAPWRWAAELGWSHRPGVAFDAQLRQPRRNAWLQASWRPEGFAALDTARPAGAWLDGAWTEWLGERTQATATVSANRLELGDHTPRSTSARVDVQHRVAPQWSVETALGGSAYEDGRTARTERGTAALGARFEGRTVQASAQYRYQHDTATGEGGHGGRLSLRASQGEWRAQGFVDAQQNAATLDLLLPPGSPLARLFAELGLSANSPEEALRLLRDHAADFARHGVEVGGLRTEPLRVQAGVEAAWRPQRSHLTQVGLRWLRDESRGGPERRGSRLATLFASWRLFGRTHLDLGWTRWSIGGQDDDSWQAALRTAFSDLSLPGMRRGIEGSVLHDDGRPLAGVDIVLDGLQRTRTDGAGRFVFDQAGPGTHRVEAFLGPQAQAYFLGPSSLGAGAGDAVSFEVMAAPAHVAGTVLSDAGLPVAGVTVRLEGRVETSVVTDSSGAFRFATPPGAVRVAVVPESVPAGYELAGLEPQSRAAAIDAPARADFVLRAQRSVQGMLRGQLAGATLSAPALGRRVEFDAEGRFVLRGLPAGPLELVLQTPRGRHVQVVEVPAAPGRTAVELPVP